MTPFDLDDKEVKVSKAAFMAGMRHLKKTVHAEDLQGNASNFWDSPCDPDKIVEQFKQAMMNYESK